MSDRPGRRRSRVRRRPEAASRPAAVAADASPAPRRSRLPIVLALLGGALIARFLFALLPADAYTLLDFAIAGGFALALAMTYRRYMRRYMAEQRRRREG